MSTSDSIPRLRRAGLWIGAPFLALALVHVPPPQAAFDYNPLTSLKANPTITGNATSSVPLDFKVVGKDGAVAYNDGAMLVLQNRFAETVYPPIANGKYTLEILSGSSTVATGTLTVGLRTGLDIVSDDSIASYDVADGHLMRFQIHTESTDGKMRTSGRGVAISQLTFTVVPTNASVADIQLYGYTDPGFSVPIIASTTGALNSVPVELSATSSVITILPDLAVEIPAGQTYYFDLVGTVTPSDTSYNVLTTMLPDTDAHFSVFADAASTSNFVWSPNTYGTSSLLDDDWLSGAAVSGLPTGGFAEVRTNAPPSGAPTCAIQSSTSTAPSGTPVTLTWSTMGATRAVWDSGATAALFGTGTYVLGSTTRTYILDLTGPYGFGNCFATVVVPQAAATGTGSVATTTDGFTASPATGAVSLAVTFAGSVNNIKSCAAQTFTLGYGDGASSTIAVPASLCKAQSFTLPHTYTKAGTFTAGLYRGTGTSTGERIQTQVILAQTKVAFLLDPSNNLASVISAAGSGLWQALQTLFAFFR